MRRLAALLASLVASALMVLSLPWDSFDCQPPECVFSTASFGWNMPWIALLVMSLSVVVPGTILTAILVAVLRLRDASTPADAAVRYTLGETRGAAVRTATKRGAADALVWVGGAYVAFGVAHLAMLASTNYPLTMGAALWQMRLLTAITVAACLVAAHIIDVVRTGHSHAVTAAIGSDEPRERRLSLSRRTRILAAAATSAAAFLAGLNLVFQGGTDAAPTLALVAGKGAAWLLGLTVAALAWTVLMPKALESVPRIVAIAGTVADKLRAHEVGAVLHARASTRWLASSRVIVVLMGLAFLFGLASTAPASRGWDEYTAFAAGVPVGSADQISRCDADCADALEYAASREGVGATVPAASAGIDIQDGSQGITFVDPADLVGVDDALAARLRAEPSVVLSPPTWETVSIDDFDWLGIDVTGIGELPAAFPRPIVNRAWAEAQMGTLDTAYYYAYPADGWTPNQTYTTLVRTTADYPWAIEQGDRADWVDGNASGGGMSAAAGDPNQNEEVDRIQLVQNLALGGMLAALILVPIAAVATAAVLRRRRDDATMAALGASVSTLRAAVVIEATVTATIALATGLLGGALTLMAVGLGQGGVAGLYGVQLDDIILHTPASVNWAALAAVLAAAVAVFALASWIAAHSLRTLTPVEALRPVNEGVLR